MARLREEVSLSQLPSLVKEEERDEGKRAERRKICASEYTEYRVEKVFPMYAMGPPRRESGSLPPLAGSGSGSTVGDPIWDAIREEAKLEAEKEPILSSFLYASILSHSHLEQALGFVLANRLQNPTLLATQLMDIFSEVIMHDRGIQRSVRVDLQAFKDRDPSCLSYCSALLHMKGYHSLQSYRVAHALWNQGRQLLALALQSRISEVFGVDIHPAAKIGEGILLDHATGVVIGETAVVGDRVSLMQGVTLGGTGKEIGDRHPKVSQGALIGASVTILGNIKIGEGAMVAAGSLVLKDVPPHSMVAGIPAKMIGFVDEQDPSLTMKHVTWYMHSWLISLLLMLGSDATKEFFENVAVTSMEAKFTDALDLERKDGRT
ncbi:serine acetyltransferase 2-like isoform X2 [Malania oleifera]|uniref:serine acetyltransferase 2-like isoform X2 n=1 Tax=Malania oleifera TaxID=397392 RepID=UPI0025AEC693|nr:serine acetyltransferase 2-like isoform X2 [Malania oleifera]